MAKSKYETHVEPRLGEIEDWARGGMREEDIAKNLGISAWSWYSYKNKFPKISQVLTHARARMVTDIKDALLKKALGFQYEEEKRVGKKDKNGENIVLVEKYSRYCPPSETAAAMLLRNYDPEWRDTDNATAELRKQAQDLKKAIAESTNFDLIFNDKDTEN